MMKSKWMSLAFVACAVMLFSSSANAVKLDWISHNSTVIIDNTVQVTKPSGKWDTQTKHYEDPAPVKWVRHIKGANPEIFLRYRHNVKGKTAHHYANYVKQELSRRGISVYRTEKKVINGRNIAILYGRSGKWNYMVGVWRHRNVGFLLEGKAEDGIFAQYQPEFERAIYSVRILKESGL